MQTASDYSYFLECSSIQEMKFKNVKKCKCLQLSIDRNLSTECVHILYIIYNRPIYATINVLISVVPGVYYCVTDGIQRVHTMLITFCALLHENCKKGTEPEPHTEANCAISMYPHDSIFRGMCTSVRVQNDYIIYTTAVLLKLMCPPITEVCFL